MHTGLLIDDNHCQIGIQETNRSGIFLPVSCSLTGEPYSIRFLLIICNIQINVVLLKFLIWIKTNKISSTLLPMTDSVTYRFLAAHCCFCGIILVDEGFLPAHCCLCGIILMDEGFLPALLRDHLSGWKIPRCARNDRAAGWSEMQKRRGRFAGSADKHAPPFLLYYILKPCHSEPTSGEESGRRRRIQQEDKYKVIAAGVPYESTPGSAHWFLLVNDDHLPDKSLFFIVHHYCINTDRHICQINFLREVSTYSHRFRGIDQGTKCVVNAESIR